MNITDTINRGLKKAGAPEGWKPTGHGRWWNNGWWVELSKEGQLLEWEVNMTVFDLITVGHLNHH